jgi:hypothetical protein
MLKSVKGSSYLLVTGSNTQALCSLEIEPHVKT